MEREAKGPNIGEMRDNIVHVLGTFMDDALELKEYLPPRSNSLYQNNLKTIHHCDVILPIFDKRKVTWSPEQVP